MLLSEPRSAVRMDGGLRSVVRSNFVNGLSSLENCYGHIMVKHFNQPLCQQLGCVLTCKHRKNVIYFITILRSGYVIPFILIFPF